MTITTEPIRPADTPDNPEAEPTLPVFNRTSMTQGVGFHDDRYIELPSGVWTQVPRSFVYANLLSNPDLTVHLDYDFSRSIKDKLTICTNLEYVTGWGNLGVNFVHELSQLRSDLMLYPISRWMWHHGNEGEVLPETVASLMRAQWKKTEWTLAFTIPTELDVVPGNKIALLSMWETGSLPDGWGEECNRKIKHLIVPSESQVDLWRAGGYHGDISVVPLGIDPSIWKYKERPARTTEPFTLITFGLLGTRKSPAEIIHEVCYRAFSSIYGDYVDDWKLILKTFPIGDFKGLSFIPEDPHIQVVNVHMSAQGIANLCYRADMGIFLSKFEGYGLCPREAMATGLPILISENSGHLDDCSPTFNVPIPCVRNIPAQEGYNSSGWYWFEPDYALAAECVRQEYENWKERGKTQSPLGTRAANHMHAVRTWKRAAERLSLVLDDVMAGRKSRFAR